MISSLAAIHIAKKALALSEETFRARLMEITGRASTRDLTEGERRHLLTVLRSEQLLRKSTRFSFAGKLSGRYALKLQALWIAGWNLGIFADRRDIALENFVKRQTSLERERFLHHADDAAKVIEALKAWMAREAGVVWAVRRGVPAWERRNGYRIARAQWAMIEPEGEARFWPEVTGILGISAGCREVSDAQWIIVMNRFGKQIRAARKAGR